MEENKQFNSHMFENIYKDLEIDINKLGCVMLDIVPLENIPVNEEYLYYARDKSHFWIDGLVVNKVGHITILYGLLKSAVKWAKYVRQVLKGWAVSSIQVEDIGFFESPIKEEPYYCIVAFAKMTDELIEGKQRLELLPHINIFTEYKPHVTLAYIKKDEQARDFVIEYFRVLLNGEIIKLKEELNLGK